MQSCKVLHHWAKTQNECIRRCPLSCNTVLHCSRTSLILLWLIKMDKKRSHYAVCLQVHILCLDNEVNLGKNNVILEEAILSPQWETESNFKKLFYQINELLSSFTKVYICTFSEPRECTNKTLMEKNIFACILHLKKFWSQPDLR